MTIDEKLSSFWIEQPFLQTQSNYILGLSGGVDSMTLTHGLIQNNLINPEKIVLVYINHNLRPEAKQEEQFVREQAEKWGTQVEIGRIEELPESYKDTASSSSSIENNARQARYYLLAQIARQYKSNVVIVAHHEDDQAETLLINLLRGSGLAGLTGMQAVAPYPLTEFAELSLIRPLLNVSRADIDTYAKTARLATVYDSSNENLAFTRNRIRHELLPFLERYNPQIRHTLSRTANILANDHNNLIDYTSKAWQEICHAQGVYWARFSLQKWQDQPVGQQRALLRHIMKVVYGHTQNLSYANVEQARHILHKQATGQIALLANGVQLHIFYNQVIAISTHEEEISYSSAFDLPQIKANQTITLTVSHTHPLNQTWAISFNKQVRSEVGWEKIKQNRWVAVIQTENQQTLVIRGRKSGDRFRPYGANGSKKLKDWMIDRKIPAILRNNWPLVVNALTDEILWVVGYEISQSVAVTNDTTAQITHLVVSKAS